MHTRFIPRLLVLSLLFAFVFGAAIQFRQAAASDHTRWTDTVSAENELVQACAGFNVTGSYTADRASQVVENYDGSLFYERRDVTFTGALGNATSGTSYAYDGQFTRITSPGLGKIIVSNLSLRFEVDTPGEFSVSLKRVEFDVGDDPHSVVKAIVPNVLRMDLCQLFGGSTIGGDPIAPSSHPSAGVNIERIDPNSTASVRTENSIPNPSVVVPSESSVLIPPAFYGEIEDSEDDATPWTELDPCDWIPSGRPC